MVAAAVDEEGGLGTGKTGDMRIVEILAQGGDAVGKAAILALAVLDGHLHIGGHHPAYSGRSLDAVAEGGEHPRTVGTHGTAGTADAEAVDLGQGGKKLGTCDIVVGHEGAEVAAEHHHVSGNDVVLAAVHTFLAPALAPHGSIGGEHHIAATGEAVAKECSAIETVDPFGGIADDDGVFIERPYHLLLADEEVGTVVVKEVDGGERTFAVGHKQIGRDARIGIDVELDLAGGISVAALLADDSHVERCSTQRRSHHALEHLGTGMALPLCKVFGAAVAPRHGIGQLLLELLHIAGQVEGELVLGTLLQRRLGLLLGTGGCYGEKQEQDREQPEKPGD